MAATGRLAGVRIRFREEPHVGVAVAARGYPDTPETGKAILGLDAAGSVPGALVFHAGTADRDGAVVTVGAVVLTVAGRGQSFAATPSPRPTRPFVTCASTACKYPAPTSAARRFNRNGISIVTFGCRVNQADSLEIEGALLSHGGTCVPAAEADLVVVNTCSVTRLGGSGRPPDGPQGGSREPPARDRGDRVLCHPGVPTTCGAAGRGARRARTATRTMWPTCSCPWSLAPGAPGRDDPGAWRLRPEAHNVRALYRARRGPVRSAPCAGRGGTHRVHAARPDRAAASSPDCIIPHARHGPLEADRVGAGWGCRRRSRRFREITVCGVHLGSHGRDLGDGSSLAGLVRMLGDWPADVLFRISSLEPMDCGPEFVAAMAMSRRLAPHLDLPLQHGDEAMLRADAAAVHWPNITNGS